MSALSSASASRPWGWLLFALVTAVLLIAYPPFKFVSKRAAAESATVAASQNFDAPGFVSKFWTEQLMPAATAAPDAAPILADLRRDPIAATNTHARRVGLGNAAYYFARGMGTVTAVERNRLLVEIDGATVAVRTGPVFGNAVRDGCGLLEVNDAPGLAEFNALSAELNRIVEDRVLPAIRDGAAVGSRIVFAGCAEAPESIQGDGPLLTFIPVRAEVTP